MYLNPLMTLVFLRLNDLILGDLLIFVINVRILWNYLQCCIMNQNNRVNIRITIMS
jgi:hypothetical protein